MCDLARSERIPRSWPLRSASLLQLPCGQHHRYSDKARTNFAVCAGQDGMGAKSTPDLALDASDIDSGWDLIGDLREALPDMATNGASVEGIGLYPCSA